MDNIQIYYTCLLVIGFVANCIVIGTTKDAKTLASKIAMFLFTSVIALPIALRIYKIW